MLVCCFSVKGGVGVTVTAAGLALSLGELGGGSPVTLVDLGGDLPAVLAVPEPGPGVADWLAAGADVPPEGLDRVGVAVSPNVDLVPLGSGILVDDPGRAEVLARLLASRARGGSVVVDMGRIDMLPASLSDALMEKADRRLLVTRACYVALSRARRFVPLATDVVLIEEEGRALDRVDVSTALGVPLAATVALDVAVARAVDSGLLVRRLPRPLRRPMDQLAEACS